MIEKQCKWCDKVLEGHTLNQVDHQYLQHILAHHKDKIQLEE